MRIMLDTYLGIYCQVKTKLSIVSMDNSENYLPELDIQAGFSKFVGFCNRVGYISRYSIFNFSIEYICKMKDTIAGNPMDSTPESEYKFIREAVSKKLDRHILNPSNKVWRDSIQIKP